MYIGVLTDRLAFRKKLVRFLFVYYTCNLYVYVCRVLVGSFDDRPKLLINLQIFHDHVYN